MTLLPGKYNYNTPFHREPDPPEPTRVSGCTKTEYCPSTGSHEHGCMTLAAELVELKNSQRRYERGEAR